MKKSFKKITTIMLLAATLSTTLLSGQNTLQAKSKLNIKNSIKLNTTQTFTTKGIYKGFDTLNYTNPKKFLEETNVTVKQTIKSRRVKKGKNYKVTFTITKEYSGYPKATNLTNQKDYAAADFEWGITEPHEFYSVFDKKTGISLEGKNKIGVKVKQIKDTISWYPKQYFYWYNDEKDKVEKIWYRGAKKSVTSFTVTYPKKHKPIVVALGYANYRNDFTADEKYNTPFWKGKKPYWKTSMYKKGKDTVLYTTL